MAPRNHVTENQPMQADQHETPLKVLTGPFKVGDVLPARMVAADMQRLFGISPARFYALVAAGSFDAFEILPKIGPRAWSGERLSQYLRGEAISTRFFGRKAR